MCNSVAIAGLVRVENQVDRALLDLRKSCDGWGKVSAEAACLGLVALHLALFIVSLPFFLIVLPFWAADGFALTEGNPMAIRGKWYGIIVVVTCLSAFVFFTDYLLLGRNFCVGDIAPIFDAKFLQRAGA